MIFLGPVRRLRILSTVFPSLLSDEEQLMRNADMILQSVPIRWYRRMKIHCVKERKSVIDTVKDATSCGGVGDVTCGAEGCLSSDMNKKTKKSCKEDKTAYTPYFGVDSTINIIDTDKGPALEIISNHYNFEDNDSDNEDDSPKMSSGSYAKSIVMRKVVPFREIEKIVPGEELEWKSIGVEPSENSFMIYAKQNENVAETVKQSPDETATANTGDETNSIAATKTTSTSSLLADGTRRVFACSLMPNSKLSLTRGEAIRHLNALVNWDKIDPSVNENNSDFSLNFSALRDTVMETIRKKNENVNENVNVATENDATQSSSYNQSPPRIPDRIEIELNKNGNSPVSFFKKLETLKRKDEENIVLPPSPIRKTSLPPSPNSVLSGLPFVGMNISNSTDDNDNEKEVTATSPSASRKKFTLREESLAAAKSSKPVLTSRTNNDDNSSNHSYFKSRRKQGVVSPSMNQQGILPTRKQRLSSIKTKKIINKKELYSSKTHEYLYSEI